MTEKLVAAQAAASELEGVLAHRPELASRYRAFMQSLRSEAALPPRLLELCRLRIAHVHGCTAELAVRDDGVELSAPELDELAGGRFERFDEAEQAALEIAELIPFAHHQLSDAQVARADVALGHAGCVALLTALAFFDVTCRLKMTLGFSANPQSLAADHLV